MSFHHGVPGDRSQGGYGSTRGADHVDLDTPPPDDPQLSRLVVLAVVAGLGGAVTGLVGRTFRWLLAEITVYRDQLHVWSQGSTPVRWIVPVLLGAVAAPDDIFTEPEPDPEG